MEIEEILHGGEYTDRRGRRWTRTHRNNWLSPRRPRVSAIADESQMRLLIERDQHRDVCPGLSACQGHPVPFVEKHVQYGGGSFAVIDTTRPGGAIGSIVDEFPTHTEAMDTARALAVGC